MPAISMFYGIIIYMYYFDDRKHKQPHIHAQYGNFAAALSIPGGDVLSGSLPQSKLKLVQAWIEIHSEDLMANWPLSYKRREIV